MKTFTFTPGTTPLLVSLPHVGTIIPDEFKARFCDRALAVDDTDWHLERLYDFVLDRGASLIYSQISRYVMDLNRPPSNEPMYPGANNTELCPTRSFSGDRLYRDGLEPDNVEIARRRTLFWQPYHDALATELERLKLKFGYALLFDGHSIRSVLPWLFPGKLPDLNLGTADGSSCAGSLERRLEQVLQNHNHYTHVINGRFKGGYITRHYGRPAQAIHAVQLEMCWSLYMEESSPYEVDPARAQLLRPVLMHLVDSLLGWRPDE